ncbi:MAG: hypothetical protein ACN6O6_15480 [Pseudomonas sp.]|uniref:hypothetical protein n=1 Tax=Pseudomonas sp. TaxID=306 RepID=UPI003D129F4F
MKLPHRAALLASVLLLPAIAQANDKPLVETLSAFTQCDASFFSSLQTHRASWEALVPLKHEKHASWIAVENRTKEGKDTVPIQGTPHVAGMKLVSYFDQSADLDDLGNYLFWGFIIDGSPDQVARQLAPLLKHPEQLKPLGPTFVRSELRLGDRWQLIQPLKGAPGTARLERVLLLEADGRQPDRTRLSCSLQGATDKAAYAEVRPDIPATDYPQPVPATDITDVVVPEGVLQRLDVPLLQPKFTSLRYTYASSKSSSKKSDPITIEIKVENGLLNKTEIYSPSFQVQRLVKADLIQLKSKMVGIGDGRVLVTQQADVLIPKDWATGQTLSARLEMEETPAKPGDEQRTSEMTCTVGKRYPAAKVFASLAGDAIELTCEQSSYRSVSAFIEDLGLAITLESTSDDQHLYEVTALEVVR